MRKIWHLLAVAVVALGLGLAVVGCNSSTPEKDKRQGSNMEGDKMKGDKMKGGNMEGDKMKGDKMQGDKRKGDKMKGDKMKGDKMQGSSLWQPRETEQLRFAAFQPAHRSTVPLV